jgi:hypothetical protein
MPKKRDGPPTQRVLKYRGEGATKHLEEYLERYAVRVVTMMEWYDWMLVVVEEEK